MTESPTPSKFAKWKRALIGGLLSGLIVGVVFGVPYLAPPALSVMEILGIPFMAPLLILELFSFEVYKRHSQAIYALPEIWFIIGAIISYSTKTNIRAFSIWFWLLVLLTPVSIIIYVLLNFGT